MNDWKKDNNKIIPYLNIDDSNFSNKTKSALYDSDLQHMLHDVFFFLFILT